MLCYILRFYNSTIHPLFQIAQQFADEFLNHVRHYMQRVVDHTHSEVGKCWPMSRVYNATLIATCDEILNPFVSFCFMSRL